MNDGVNDAKHHDGKINIFVNNTKHEVTHKTMTPREILENLAHENVSQVALSLKEKGHLEKFEQLDQPIQLKNGMHFIVTFLGATPVS